MKALKSKLAAQLLADPAASDQLRNFLVNRPASGSRPQQAATERVVIRSRNGALTVQASVVPKAAKAA
ncbi:hypothetical protein [Massilia sp. Mn16-1_5]|uniref:hypothetical protein n=1 Tax=Massilia sp. Mn16-1_5 TaxID=2079199 RepID=UPI00109E82F9|nr:hypothetical protein [Massilia sp. Mn16-1_5]